MPPIRPVRTLPAEPGYPSILLPGTPRRRFLTALIGGAGAALVGARRGLGQSGGLLKAEIPLRRRHVFDACDLVAEKLLLQTRDARLARFIRTTTEQPELEAAVLAVLGKATCADVTDRKKLVRLEGLLAQAVLARFRARTRHAAALPIATLILAQKRPVTIDGFLDAPARPLPRP